MDNDENPVRGIIIDLGATFLFVAGWLLVALNSGCTTLPREGIQHNTITNAVRIVAEVAVQVREARRDAEGEPSGENTADPGQPAKPAATGAAPVLDFRYGGFKGGGAVEDPATQIADLHVTRTKMTYRWLNGDLGAWGLARTEAGALACAFYWDGSAWRGGKFDWISTSRTTRDWNNLDAGYGGWDAAAFWAAPKRAFCIVSRDGRKRTNLIETTEP